MKIAPSPGNGHTTSPDPTLDATSVSLQAAEFEDLCCLVAEICRSPANLVSIIDAGRSWFLSHHPLITKDATIQFAHCTQAQHHPNDTLIITDLNKDHRFENVPMVKQAPYAAFYAGIPLVGQNGNVLATLCIWDSKNRMLEAHQLKALGALARQVASLLEAKIASAAAAAELARSKTAYSELEHFTTIAAHDIKSPLNAMISLTDLLSNNYADKLDEEGNDYVMYLHNSALNLTDLVTAVLTYSRATNLLTEQRTAFNFGDLVKEVLGLLQPPANISISFDDGREIITNRTALKQILLSLTDNAIKYNGSDSPAIGLRAHEVADGYEISVTDNGPGIPADRQVNVFDLFRHGNGKKQDQQPLGSGLAIVGRLAAKLGGSAKLHSDATGTTVSILLPK